MVGGIMIILRPLFPYVVGAAIVVSLGGGAWLYGKSQYRAGYGQSELDSRLAAIAIAQAAQEEKDRADAQYRAAVLARQAIEKNLAAARVRADGLLAQLRRAQSPKASPGSDGAGDDWIGILGACLAEYEWMGGQAGKLADKVGGLQGYIRAVRSKAPIIDRGQPK